MNFNDLDNDDAVLAEIGQRLARHRIEQDLTQAQVAEMAGIGKRTVERIETGHSAQTTTFVRILRILGLMAKLDELIPEPGPRPMDLLKLKGKERRRASTARERNRDKKPWSWGDES